MRILPFAALFLTFLAFACVANALDSGLIFSAEPGADYKCVYINLPQDLGLSSVDRESETIIQADRSSNPWVDTTYSRVVMTPGILNKNPVCFYYSDKQEGEFSFYSISLSSDELGVSNSISGGLCVSNYADVDTGVDATNTTDICRLLSENSDIIDLSFGEDVTQAKPGEVVTKTLYITSYAELRIRLSIATNLQNDFGDPILTTSPSKPTATKTFKIKAPESEGEFEFTVLAQAEGCSIQACKKQKQGILAIDENAKEGFSVSVIPRNINLKEAGEVTFRVVISNRGDTQNFTIEPAPEPSMGIEPQGKTISVDQNEEKTAVFTATPGGGELYRIDFKITTPDAESVITSYVSVGELLSDAKRYAEDAEKTATPDIKEEIRKARKAYEQSYNETSYGEDLQAQEDFLNTIDELKTKAEATDKNVTQANPQEDGFNWAFVTVPVVIIAALALVFVAFRKAKRTASGDEYGGYGYHSRRDGRE